MSSIYIDFGYDDNVKRSLNSAKRAISSRISDYQGIQRELNNTTSHTNNLSTANTYIQRKINTLQDKYNRLDRFAERIRDFNDNATAIDRRVADRINTETNQFYKRENIPHGFLYTIGSAFCEGVAWLGGKIKEGIDNFVEGCKNVWETVKQWYEDNKYWIDIVVDVVCVVAAVAALIASGGVASFIFAAWGLAKATADLCYDVVAYGAYKDGDMEAYEEMSNKGLKDFMKENLGTVGEGIYYGMEIASAIYGIYKIGKSVSTIFKDYKALYKNDTFMSAKLSDITKRDIIKSDIKLSVFKAIGITNLDANTGQFNVSNTISAVESIIKTTTTVLDSDKSVKDKIKSSIKIVSTFDKIVTNFSDLTDAIAKKTFPANGNSVIVASV